MNFEETTSDILAQCEWIPESGIPCRNFALPESNYCFIHQTTTKSSSAQNNNDIRNKNLLDQLIQEFKSLLKRLELQDTISENSNLKNINNHISSEKGNDFFKRLQKVIEEDIFDIDTWRGAWYMLNYTYEYQSDLIKRRFRGEYETDEWGLDIEFLNTIMPIFEILYKKYWRVETTGIEHVPSEGSAFLIANHSGQLPWDTIMLFSAIKLENGRLIRTLYDPAFSKTPFFSDFFNKLGQTQTSEDNMVRLISQGELTAVFPEGFQGIGKLYKNRYQLEPFRHTEFIKVALQINAPIIPVSIVGAEEAYISLGNSETLARFTGAPYFPLTPTWPFLGLFGTIPLPTKWFIDFHEPLYYDDFGSEASTDISLIYHLAEYARGILQNMVNSRLKNRESIFFG